MGIEEINIEPLEKVTDNTANPTTECLYPQCEKCSRYIGIGGVYYCTVPMVVNKQIWLLTASKIRMLERCLAELQTTVFDHILGEYKVTEYKLKDEPTQNPSVKITEVEP